MLTESAPQPQINTSTDIQSRKNKLQVLFIFPVSRLTVYFQSSIFMRSLTIINKFRSAWISKTAFSLSSLQWHSKALGVYLVDISSGAITNSQELSQRQDLQCLNVLLWSFCPSPLRVFCNFFICLVASGLSCSNWDLLLQHMDSLS